MINSLKDKMDQLDQEMQESAMETGSPRKRCDQGGPEIAYAPVSAPSKVGSDEVRCCVCGSVRHWNIHTNARH